MLHDMGLNDYTTRYTYTGLISDVPALRVYVFVGHGQRRVVDHGHDGHGHVGPHDVRVRHAQEQHEGDEVPPAETTCGIERVNE